ncbi:MAG: hypothetical protein QOH16_2133 [Gaiellaceae bacterium]|nr:hypothetical protein [Gaiellaceae bacterium]
MTDADGVLAARFAATYDHTDTGDWADVLQRYGPTRARRRRTLLIAIALIAVLAPTALAIRNLFSTGHYSLSNRGQLLTKRAHTNWFNGHGYKLYLLGTAGGSAFYRAEVAPHYNCWGRGDADKIGVATTLGCPTVVGAYPLQLDDQNIRMPRGARVPTYVRIDGIVVDQARSVALEDDRGHRLATTTVKNNLFSFAPPLPKGFLRVVVLDAQGKPLAPHPKWGEHQSMPVGLYGPRATEARPARLKKVAQRASAQGVTVSVEAADKQPVVDFDSSAIAPAAKARLTGRHAYFSCFAITGDNVRRARVAGDSGLWKPRFALKMTGYVKPPFDGCSVGGTGGHSWHDRYGAHSEVEVAFNERGKRYFEDRAAARDLAEFVRSKQTRSIRVKTGAPLVSALKRAYGSQVDVLGSRGAVAPAGRVGVFVSGPTTVFSEQSTVGVRFFVEFRNGKRVRDDLRGIAFVY